MNKSKMKQTRPGHYQKKGFTLHDFPTRREYLEHNLKVANRQLQHIKQRLQVVEPLTRRDVVPLRGPSYDLQLDSLITKRRDLEGWVKSMEHELNTLEEKEK
ncbi:MAG TPA: hypothetical protein PKI66_03860 [Methanobacteriaceae archaeon]|nr:hypothetical protein [Methanobacteriaceae archaeon]HNS25297.1 hypothetical protein [Methanobacteriaceae archaeon]